MSEAEKRRDWRAWEATRDEHALRRYVWALCREAPPTPPDTSALRSRYVRWLDADYHETSSSDGLPPADDLHGLARTSLYEKPPRTVTAPVRRLTVCGPWLPKFSFGWDILRQVPGTVGVVTVRLGGSTRSYPLGHALR